ncbi:hypothetical protein YYC_03851 [Plasmodium yoelii 17X]|uniref:Uncharacterized protein n=1 Tax=Plasmodium yoelii 17X TaxID=1323249 RepID=V7PGJ0_PLAYE|nr:hypothetical protein YYC_03851 [Plasmodium yoelii 17X]
MDVTNNHKLYYTSDQNVLNVSNLRQCKKFQDLTTNLEYDSSNGIYRFINNEYFKEYCTGEICDNDFNKINIVCLFLFNEIFGSPSSFSFIAKRNTNIVEYIMIWLSYMLNFNKIQENDTIKNFYEEYITKDERYIKDINNVSGYKNYKDLIDKKENLMSIYVKDMSKFYDAFVLLCHIYIEFNGESLNCFSFSGIANDFAKKYDELNENYNNGKGSPYNQLLSTLSNDYNNLKNKCNDFPSLPTYSRRLCKTFTPLRNVISNSDNVVSYQFTDDSDYCIDVKCNNDTDKMNARCLHIFDAFFKDKSVFENVAKGNIYIVQYILIWLSYVLSLIKNKEDDNRNIFYNTYINEGNKYNQKINEVTDYQNYKDLIDRNNYILSMDMSIISKLYDAFISFYPNLLNSNNINNSIYINLFTIKI